MTTPSDNQLPDYHDPPVVEIVAAVQFVPLPRFGMPEIIALARSFDGWQIFDAPPALDPIVEAEPGTGASMSFRLGLGQPPQRLILASDDGRWLAQVQQDRIAVHERRVEERPSFSRVHPKLTEITALVEQALSVPVLTTPHAPELVEVTYVNRIAAGAGWSDFNDLDHVLRVVAPFPEGTPFDQAESTSISMTSKLLDGETFVGRLHITAEPAADDNGQRQLQLGLISRRYTRSNNLSDTLDACHRDIVAGFTAVTTDDMHEIWERFQ